MKCPSPLSVPDPQGDHASMRLTVPCGKCGACRNNRRADWSFRLQKELKNSMNGFFITLTYDDENIKTTQEGYPTLVKKDFQDFTKRLRKENKKAWKRPLRYYAVGEYGTHSNRPHFHSITFNLHPRLIRGGSTIIKWNFGLTHVGDVTPASIHYVTKFHVNVNKQVKFDPETGEIFQIEPEFALMSRNPGIGADYLDLATKWHNQNENTFVMNNGYRQRMPRYYKDKIFDPVTKKRIAKNMIEDQDKAYWREIERLKSKGVSDPESYILRSEYLDAKKVFDKSGLTDVF